MTHYQVLEVPESAPAADIRRAYRRLVLLTHPDRTPAPAAHTRYLAINVAYEVLSDPARRMAYDRRFQENVSLPQPPASPAKARDAQRRGHPAAHRPRPATRSNAYQHLYLEYATLGGKVCKALLLFCLLLGIDRVWVLDFPNERVLNSRFFSGGKVPSYCESVTQDATFRACLDQGAEVGLRRTALFGQVLSFGIRTKDAMAPLDDYKVSTPIYDGAGILFVLALLGTSATGAWPGLAGRRQVDCAMTGSIIAVIIVWLLVVY